MLYYLLVPLDGFVQTLAHGIQFFCQSSQLNDDVMTNERCCVESGKYK